MRVRRISAFLAVVLVPVLLGVTPASAAAGWTVTPGGQAVGTADQLVLHTRPATGDPDLVWSCGLTQAEFSFFSSPDSHVADITDLTFSDCLFAGLLTYDIAAHTPWRLHALSHTAPAVPGELRDVSATIIGAGCLATVAGFVRTVYDNDTHTLTLVPDFTLTFTVDPVDDCLGLFNTGDKLVLEGSLDIDPGQVITPN